MVEHLPTMLRALGLSPNMGQGREREINMYLLSRCFYIRVNSKIVLDFQIFFFTISY